MLTCLVENRLGIMECMFQPTPLSCSRVLETTSPPTTESSPCAANRKMLIKPIVGHFPLYEMRVDTPKARHAYFQGQIIEHGRLVERTGRGTYGLNSVRYKARELVTDLTDRICERLEIPFPTKFITPRTRRLRFRSTPTRPMLRWSASYGPNTCNKAHH